MITSEFFGQFDLDSCGALHMPLQLNRVSALNSIDFCKRIFLLDFYHVCTLFFNYIFYRIGALWTDASRAYYGVGPYGPYTFNRPRERCCSYDRERSNRSSERLSSHDSSKTAGGGGCASSLQLRLCRLQDNGTAGRNITTEPNFLNKH